MRAADEKQTQTQQPTQPTQPTLPTLPTLPCADCHRVIADEHARSRHDDAADNAVFAAGFAREPHDRCIACHAPTRQLRGTTHDGVSCAACHVRDGVVWSARSAAGYGHAVAVDDALADERACAGCHEFDAHEKVDGVERLLPGVPMQTTVSEWRAWRAALGPGDEAKSCQDCHMPRDVFGHARHDVVKGAHDVGALRDALVVDVEAGASGDEVVFSSRGVGHDFPTGDVFRRLLVSVDDVVIATFDRRAPLRPFEARTVRLPQRARRLVVTYHYADDAEEERGVVSYEELVVVIADITLRGR